MHRFRVTRTADEKAAITKRNAEKKAQRSAQAMTCQVCNRPILAHTGTIAHHGYTRPFEGWQTSSCPGAKKVPFEVSRVSLGEHIDNIRVQLKNTRALLQKVQDETMALSFSYRKHGGFGKSEAVFIRDITRANFDEIKAANSAKFVQYSVYNFDTLKERRITAVAREIKHFEDYIAEQSKRYNAWKAPTHQFNADTKQWDSSAMEAIRAMDPYEAEVLDDMYTVALDALSRGGKE
jgi:hypothetical protein